jgi:Asp-tRNA(Asn)/Glu-tRNA(Gln) amidotransferase A subunit family amidase
LVGRPFDEINLLRIAYVYEEHYGISEEMIPPTINE